MGAKKIFGVGLAKMGSISLQKAWCILGYKTLHYPVSWSEIDDCDAVNGTSIACRFEEVDRRYPGSQFILTLRDLEPWLKSCESHYCQRFRQEDLAPRHREFRRKNMLRLYGVEAYDPEAFTKAYFSHISRVKNYFATRTQDLLILNIPSGDGWEKLCPFLRHAIPAIPFPHANQTSEPMTLRQKIAKRIERVSHPWIDE